MASNTPITLKGKLVWVALIVFVAGWMFVLGIMVGRGTAPIPLAPHSMDNELAELQAAESKSAKSASDGETAPAESVEITELGFYEELRKPSVQKPVPPPQLDRLKPDSTPVVKTETEKQKKNAAVIKQKETAIPVEGEKKPAPKIPVDEKSETKEIKPDHHFTVQVAALQDIENAKKLVAELRRNGFDAYQIRSQSQNGSIWYRVRVGAYQDRETAETILPDLAKLNLKGMVLRTP